MCGGDPNRASREAEAAERARQSQVAQATSAIDRAFNGRSSQLSEFAQALREMFMTDANRQKSIADRQLKFSLARGGLTGGSTAADQGTQLGREFQEGVLRGERNVQGSVADLQAADEASRQNLIALAQGGAGVATSANNAANAMRANLAGARSSATPDALGDIFQGTFSLLDKQKQAAERRRGLKESEVYATPFGR